jgi:hypothetical protein
METTVYSALSHQQVAVVEDHIMVLDHRQVDRVEEVLGLAQQAILPLLVPAKVMLVVLDLPIIPVVAEVVQVR